MIGVAALAAVALIYLLQPRVSRNRLGKAVPRAGINDSLDRSSQDERRVPRRHQVSSTRRTERELARSLPEAADLLALCLAAGADVPTALRAVGESMAPAPQQALHQAAALMELGVPPTQAFTHWNGVADPMVRAFERSQRTGAALAEECARVAADLRAEEFGRVQQRARSVGVRAVFPLMGCFLPAFVLLGVVPVVAALALSLMSST